MAHGPMTCLAFAGPTFVGAASICLSAFLALPIALPDRPATIILLPGQEQTVLAAVISLDPEVRLLGFRAGGLLLTVEYKRADLPTQLTGVGVVSMIGVGSFGCH